MDLRNQDTAGIRVYLKDLLLERSVRRGTFRLSSGEASNFYIDCRKSTMCNAGINLIGELIVRLCKEMNIRPVAVYGPESAGIPLVSAAVLAFNSQGILSLPVEGGYVRKEVKTYGTASQIEGYMPKPFEPVLVVEDVVTTGSSLIKAIEVLRNNGAVVLGAIVMVDRMQGAREKILGMSIPFRAMLTTKELGLE